MAFLLASRRLFFGHGIITAFMKRMAAGDALDPQPSSPQYTESLDGFVGVHGARGLVDAIAPQSRRNISLVEADEAEDQGLDHD